MRSIISGRVLHVGGAPVAGAVVQPRSLDVPAKPIPELVVATDKRGAYQWTLDPGRYEINVKPPVDAVASPPPQTVTVTAGQTVTVDFTLR